MLYPQYHLELPKLGKIRSELFNCVIGYPCLIILLYCMSIVMSGVLVRFLLDLKVDKRYAEYCTAVHYNTCGWI